LRLDELSHQCHDVGLRNGLFVPDGQRLIAVSHLSQFVRHEFMAGNMPHCGQYAGICDVSSRHVPVDHLVPSVAKMVPGLERLWLSGIRLPALPIVLDLALTLA
jgi:hypothetical protein